MKDRELAKLLRQTQQKAEQSMSKKPTKKYDPTLVTKREVEDEDIERERLFKELKRREF
jgi:hypothetical protein